MGSRNACSGNELKHGNQPRAEENVGQNDVWEVRNRIMGKGKFKKNDVDVVICSNWVYLKAFCIDC